MYFSPQCDLFIHKLLSASSSSSSPQGKLCVVSCSTKSHKFVGKLLSRRGSSQPGKYFDSLYFAQSGPVFSSSTTNNTLLFGAYTAHLFNSFLQIFIAAIQIMVKLQCRDYVVNCSAGENLFFVSLTDRRTRGDRFLPSLGPFIWQLVLLYIVKVAL